MSTQILRENSSYGGAFRAHQDRLHTTSAPWVERLRDGAFDRFDQLGFPTTHEEEWKYTNAVPLTRMNFEPMPDGSSGSDGTDSNQLKQFVYEESCKSQLVFINGSFRPDLSELSALPEGVVALDLADAIRDDRYSSIVSEHLARGADYDNDAFTALNTAFLSGGACLIIPKGVVVEPPVHLLFFSSPEASHSLYFPRVLIVAQQDSISTVIESYSSQSSTVYWTNAVVEIVLEEGAKLKHYKLQHESVDAFHIAKTAVGLGRNSYFDTTTITLGAKLSRHDIRIRLDHEGAECHVDGLYIVSDGQHTDTHSLIDHLKPHCTSRQLYKGILDGKSRAVFNGKVFVHPGAQQTDAQQTNRNLLLSNDARVDTKPQLEIFADDVKCAHGATVGQLEEEELFYLISRGLHPELAQNLLTFGFAEEVIDKIKIESIKSQLGEVVLNRLHARLEV